MVRVRIWMTAASLVAMLFAVVHPGHASDSAPSGTWTVAFSSVEAETLSSFATTGIKRGMNLPNDPQSLFVSASTGVSLSDGHRARMGKIDAGQIDMQARLMIGFERAFPQFFMSFGLGPSLARIKSSNGTFSSNQAGVVGQLDLWWRPRDDLSLSLASVGDTAEQSWWNRVRIGWRPLGLPFALGPEASASVGRNWSKLKAGFHIGDIKFWKLGFDASGGWMIDEKNRKGSYISAALYLRY